MADGTDLVVGPEPTATSAHVEVLSREEMVVVTSSGHPFADRESVSVPDLAREPFVHYDPENGMGVWIDQFVAARQTSLTVVLRTRSPRTAAQLAGAGMGGCGVFSRGCTATSSRSRWFLPMRWCAGCR
ncbi:LysR family transcriptional regulator substrate-binding protein [Streptomyces glomeratus]|uniref:LysR substrate-binding domain-containing protein n=1 Tax=Streptomyces glomeratus TaxID=284452 RepID=A0ABP6LQD6_9ACTN